MKKAMKKPARVVKKVAKKMEKKREKGDEYAKPSKKMKSSAAGSLRDRITESK